MSAPVDHSDISATQGDLPSLRDWLAAAPFTLTLSSGFFGFFAHCGVLSALLEEGLIPAQATGSSAGALVSGLWASGRSIDDLREALFELKRSDFWDPGLGLGLLRGELFEEKLRSLLACQNFSDTRSPLRITAFHCGRFRAQVFTGGPLAPAIRASCTFPGLFQPVWINGAPYIDGGVSDRPGWTGLGPQHRVFYHHLLSRSRLRGALGLTKVPKRAQTAALVVRGLPRCSPNDMSAGQHAFRIARESALCSLDRQLPYDPRGGLAVLDESVS